MIKKIPVAIKIPYIEKKIEDDFDTKVYSTHVSRDIWFQHKMARYGGLRPYMLYVRRKIHKFI